MNEFMDEESEIVELLVKFVEENQSRKILDLLYGCKDLDEAKAKVRALIDKEVKS